jgi:glycosyltransferase involved in cell wall biosynthesis
VRDEVIIVTPELERGSGGLADYTHRIVEEWGDSVATRLIAPKNSSMLLASLPPRGGKALLQYSAYGYDRLGYPRWLLRALTEWRRASGGQLAIMLHEIWAFWPLLNKNRLVQHLHRRDLRSLLTVADAVFTSTESQAAHLQQLSPGTRVQLLPVGSNISVSNREPRERERGLVALFGLQGSRIRALELGASALRALAARGVVSRLISIGGGSADHREKNLINQLKLSGGGEVHGPATEEHISALLSRASFGLSAQDELSATKSGTLMAYAAHGLNVLSVSPNPPRWTTTPAELLAEIAPEQLRERATAFRDWQERNCSWAHIAEQFARALQLQMRSVPSQR